MEYKTGEKSFVEYVLSNVKDNKKFVLNKFILPYLEKIIDDIGDISINHPLRKKLNEKTISLADIQDIVETRKRFDPCENQTSDMDKSNHSLEPRSNYVHPINDKPLIPEYDKDIVYNHLRCYRSFFGVRSSTIRTITFPPILNEIPEYFCISSSVEKVTMPKTLTRIGKHFLMDCKMIDEIEINDVKSIGSSFMADSGVKQIKFNTRSIMIIESCFLMNSRIVHINLDFQSLKTVHNHFMQQCKSLMTAKFNFPLVTEIGSHFLFECTELIDFECNTNENIQTIGGHFLSGVRKLKTFKMPYIAKILRKNLPGRIKFENNEPIAQNNEPFP